MYIQTKTIGGTKASAILGVNKYQTAFGAWTQILHGSTVPDNEAMSRGRRLEGPIAEVAGARLGLTLIEPPELTKIFDGVFSASVDRFGFIDGELSSIVEIKTASSRVDFREVPKHYDIQVQHYMHLYNLDEAHLVALQADDSVFRLLSDADDVAHAINRDAARLHVFRIERDPAYASEAIPFLRAWFEKHIVGEVPPDADGSDECRLYYTEAAGERVGELEGSDDLFDLALERRALSEAKSEIEKKLKENKNKILAKSGEARRVFFVGRDLIVDIEQRRGRETLDTDRIKSERPELYEEFKRVGSPSEVVKVKGER